MGAQLTPNRRYQVFISATYKDMTDERREAVDTIRRTHNIPVDMEQFPSGNRRSWDIIKQWIDESDIYLLILGGRYGTVNPDTGKSYTHMEFEYAIQTKKPMILCVITQEYLDEKVERQGKSVKEIDNLRKYYEFLELVRENECDFYSSLETLGRDIACGIQNAIRENNLLGWERNSKAQHT